MSLLESCRDHSESVDCLLLAPQLVQHAQSHNTTLKVWSVQHVQLRGGVVVAAMSQRPSTGSVAIVMVPRPAQVGLVVVTGAKMFGVRCKHVSKFEYNPRRHPGRVQHPAQWH